MDWDRQFEPMRVARCSKKWEKVDTKQGSVVNADGANAPTMLDSTFEVVLLWEEGCQLHVQHK